MSDLKITDFGRRRANPNATDSNFVRFAKVTDGCCTEDASCLDTLTITSTATDTLESVTVNGVVYPVAGTPQLQETDAIQAALEDILGTNLDCQEFNVWVRAAWDGSDLVISHRGACAVTAATSADPVVSTDTRLCNTKFYCDYEACVVGAIPNLTINGVSQALATGTYAYSGTPATDASTATQLQTDINAAMIASGVDYQSVTVSVNDTLSCFDVVIVSIYGTDIKNGSNRFTRTECTETFTA